MDNISTVIELDADHQIWNNELNEMIEKISDMKEVLDTVFDMNKRIKKEHFHIQLGIHLKTIDDIKEKIQKCRLHSFITKGKEHELIKEQNYNYHYSIAELIEKQIWIFNGLKDEFQLITKP